MCQFDVVMGFPDTWLNVILGVWLWGCFLWQWYLINWTEWGEQIVLSDVCRYHPNHWEKHNTKVKEMRTYSAWLSLKQDFNLPLLLESDVEVMAFVVLLWSCVQTIPLSLHGNPSCCWRTGVPSLCNHANQFWQCTVTDECVCMYTSVTMRKHIKRL